MAIGKEIIVCIYPTPPLRGEWCTSLISWQSIAGLSVEFSFSTGRVTKANEPSLLYYLHTYG